MQHCNTHQLSCDIVPNILAFQDFKISSVPFLKMCPSPTEIWDCSPGDKYWDQHSLGTLLYVSGIWNLMMFNVYYLWTKYDLIQFLLTGLLISYSNYECTLYKSSENKIQIWIIYSWPLPPNPVILSLYAFLISAKFSAAIYLTIKFWMQIAPRTAIRTPIAKWMCLLLNNN